MAHSTDPCPAGGKHDCHNIVAWVRVYSEASKAAAIRDRNLQVGWEVMPGEEGKGFRKYVPQGTYSYNMYDLTYCEDSIQELNKAKEAAGGMAAVAAAAATPLAAAAAAVATPPSPSPVAAAAVAPPLLPPPPPAEGSSAPEAGVPPQNTGTAAPDLQQVNVASTGSTRKRRRD
jgi:hypothetical protein